MIQIAAWVPWAEWACGTLSGVIVGAWWMDLRWKKGKGRRF